MRLAPLLARPGIAVATVLVALIGLAAPSGAAADTEVKGSYNIFLAGIFIAKGNLSVTVDENTYTARVGYRAAGMGGVFSGFRGAATASGLLAGTKVLAKSYYLDATDAQRQQRVSMELNGGTVRALTAEPELRMTAERVPVLAVHKRNIVDPLSAILMPVPSPPDATSPGACNRTLPIFDGWTRYDVQLSYKSTQQVKTDGYEGPVVVCGARWIPVAGHRPAREQTKFLQENRDLEVWLAPAGRLPLLVPYKVSIRTTVGVLILEAESFASTGRPDKRAALP